jgi:hypothetical protein
MRQNLEKIRADFQKTFQIPRAFSRFCTNPVVVTLRRDDSSAFRAMDRQ